MPEDRYGRCEACAKGGRAALRFRLMATPSGLKVKAGELSPKALGQKWKAQLSAYAGHPGAKAHLGLHEAELIVAKERLETIRVAPDLAAKADDVVAALRAAAERTDASW